MPRQTGSKSSAERAILRNTQDGLAGTYSFRFSGFANANPYMNYLAGVGILVLDGRGGLSGRQNSSIVDLVNQDVALKSRVYTLSGSYLLRPDATGEADIEFVSGVKKLKAKFSLVIAGDVNRFWLISTAASAQALPELVSGEAIKLQQ